MIGAKSVREAQLIPRYQHRGRAMGSLVHSGPRVLAPGRPAFSDRQMPGPEIAPGTDLVADTIGDTLAAPAPRSRRLQLRQCRIRHATRLPKAGTLHGVLLPPIGRPRSGPPGETQPPRPVSVIFCWRGRG